MLQNSLPDSRILLALKQKIKKVISKINNKKSSGDDEFSAEVEFWMPSHSLPMNLVHKPALVILLIKGGDLEESSNLLSKVIKKNCQKKGLEVS